MHMQMVYNVHILCTVYLIVYNMQATPQDSIMEREVYK